MCIATILVGIIPWQDLGDIPAPLSQAASQIMPGWLATTVTLTAVAAAASSVNILLLSFSRDVQVLAIAKVFPKLFAITSKKHGEPVYAVLFLAAFALAGIASGGKISSVATLIAMALLSMQIGLGIVVLRIPTQMLKQYQKSAFRLSRPVLWFFGGGLILLSGGFMILTIQDDPNIATIAGTYLGIGWLYYLIRRRVLANQAIDIDEEIEKACANH
jgi:amino acid transporter